MLSDLAENVIFTLVRYEGSEVLAHDTMPIWGVVFVEVCLDMLCNCLLLICLIHDFINLGNKSLFHVLSNLLDNPADVSLS